MTEANNSPAPEQEAPLTLANMRADFTRDFMGYQYGEEETANARGWYFKGYGAACLREDNRRALAGAKPQHQEGAPLTDEQIIAAWKNFSVWGFATPEDRIKRARELLALAPQPKGTRPLTEPLDPNESDPLVLWAEIARLQAATKGPEGYASWQDAATAERVRRVNAERALSAPRPLVAEPPALECLRNCEQVAKARGDAALFDCMDRRGPYQSTGLAAFLSAASLSPAPSITPEPACENSPEHLAAIDSPITAICRDCRQVGWCAPAKQCLRERVRKSDAFLDRPAPDASSTVAPAESRESLVHPAGLASAPSSSETPPEAAPSALQDAERVEAKRAADELHYFAFHTMTRGTPMQAAAERAWRALNAMSATAGSPK